MRTSESRRYCWSGVDAKGSVCGGGLRGRTGSGWTEGPSCDDTLRTGSLSFEKKFLYVHVQGLVAILAHDPVFSGDSCFVALGGSHVHLLFPLCFSCVLLMNLLKQLLLLCQALADCLSVLIWSRFKVSCYVQLWGLRSCCPLGRFPESPAVKNDCSEAESCTQGLPRT